VGLFEQVLCDLSPLDVVSFVLQRRVDWTQPRMIGQKCYSMITELLGFIHLSLIGIGFLLARCHITIHTKKKNECILRRLRL